ncbi:unnamed protein product [Heligmosomoides polygyrus]|uniref:MADF domain-containing protein n=1 Tax=Heligmosomoides polygyrus TaxID=6339 RepID=A0A183FKQ4_HELPZ|nr:unnamed protein product [Heligmosomoides polygyrus]
MMVSKLAGDESVRIITGEPVSAFDALNELWIETEDNCSAASGKKLKKELIQAVNEVASEMSLCCENIAARARDLVTQNDVLIVHNLKASPTLSAFLVAARDVREYRITPFFVPDPVMVNPNTCVCVGSGVPAMLAKKPKMDVFERETFTDGRSVDYKNVAKQKHLWSLIKSDMEDTYQKTFDEADLQRKFKNLRDSYRRKKRDLTEIARRAPGCDVSASIEFRMKTWPFYKSLTFLDEAADQG